MGMNGLPGRLSKFSDGTGGNELRFGIRSVIADMELQKIVTLPTIVTIALNLW